MAVQRPWRMRCTQSPDSYGKNKMCRSVLLLNCFGHVDIELGLRLVQLKLS